MCAEFAVHGLIHHAMWLIMPLLQHMQGIKQLRSGVESMVRLVESAGSNIFHKANQERWKDVCEEFAATNAAILSAAGDLIDASFRC